MSELRQPDNELARTYTPMVRGIVRQTMAQLGLTRDTEDLVAFGMTGLLEAHQRFRPERGIPFKSFAYYRIRGAVLDGIRKLAPMPRRAYARLKAAETVDRESELSAASVAGRQQSLSGQDAASTLDAVMGRAAAAFRVAATATFDVNERAREDPDAALQHKQQMAAVVAALAQLPDRERHLVEGHYLHDRPLDTLSAELGLSKSWGSRLHARGLDRLRAIVADDP